MSQRGLINVDNKVKKVLLLGQRWLKPKDFLNQISNKANIDIISDQNPSEEEVINKMEDIYILINSSRTYISKKIIKAGNNLKCIIVSSVGFDQVDIETATKNQIIVVNTPSADDVVSEGAILFMIALAKQFLKLVDSARKGITFPNFQENIELYGKTLGIIGLGGIGSRTAQKALSLGMNVIAFDPYVTERYAELLGTKLVDLNTLLSLSDFVSIHCLLTKETHHMIGLEQLKIMKKTAFLINTARGKVVDEKALVKYLKEGKIAGAALDVFEEEPLKTNNPLLTLNNVICTAHSISGSIERSKRVEKMVLDSTLTVLNEKLPRYIVNMEVFNKIFQKDKNLI